MDVLYDSQIFWYQKYGGISNYFSNLMENSLKYNLFDFELSLKFSNNAYIKNKSFSKSQEFLPKIDFFGKRTIFSLLNNVNKNNTLNLLNSNKFDLFHPTYYENYYLNKLKIPFVLTIYDLTPEKFPVYFKKNEFIKEKTILFENASRLICISKNTKKDLISRYNVSKDKIDVVYLAGQLDLKSEKIKVPNKYVLFVGARGKYKNFNFFVESIADSLIKNDIKLVCVGEKFSREEENFLIKNKIYRLTSVLSPNSAQLKFLYKNALLFAFPSLYEGFGIPILEAMSVGCPVVLSNTSCFPEIARKNALYFDPTSKESIKNCVEDLITNNKKRISFSKKGLIHSKNFSWDKCAIETKKVYQKVI